MTKISIVTPTHNEEQNIKILCEDIKKEFEKLIWWAYSNDNASTDNTIKILEICSKDKKVKIIINSRSMDILDHRFMDCYKLILIQQY